MGSLQDYSVFRRWWKKETPAARGYTKSYSATTPSGDILEADFNFHEKKIRLTLEIAGENGKIYVVTVKNGEVIQEKDLSSGRMVPIYAKLAPFQEIFSCLPDPDLLKTLGGLYGISKQPLGNIEERVERPWETSTRYDHIFGINREKSFWQRIFSRDREYKEPWSVRVKKRFWSEFRDLVLGTFSGLGIYYAYTDFYVLGFALAVFGLLFGGLDWMLRKRNPLLVKVLLFMSLGSYFYYVGYTRY
ncbi:MULTISPECIES: hypothetical protein [Leptospira]|uniref:Uncharacterized protein n=3 Tax=Leptospira borgpetersenii TaxID=174 RepID=A0ABP2S7Z1_LEPBO|nr:MULTISPECIES: hypothetical protein [Leptospira]AXX16302.1 hypothetical protein C4Q31_12750 [Leptospira borgpetersenii serovar Ceylonica]EKP15236.1 hypothetical protein LEP1GSC128_2411 [Leptospira borgpetersenii str. 200801926]EKQ90171.1 hypothetical protein LEP1GSC101_2206 [Leptospira borgpetersenii str. UI 09149]EMK12083.1 hypothetical protein LEP1GSC066_2931 [Leptospira sp. serovar Kenya str. Sh9]EMN13653.1 hypothetical protein LEP1GSC055_3196 [Leptospira borgpetersenii str. Brem 307]